MSLNGIFSIATSALQANQAALRATSANITNVNTEGYQRRTVEFQAASPGGIIGGVEIGELRRIADRFYAREAVSAAGNAAGADAAARVHDRLQGLFGRPDAGTGFAAQMDRLWSALGTVAANPAGSAQRLTLLSDLTAMTREIDGLQQGIFALRGDVDGEVAARVGEANGLIRSIYDLNLDIQLGQVRGESASPLLERRDAAVARLAEIIDLRVDLQPDGRAFVSTGSGVGLVSDTIAELSYAQPSVSGPDTVYPSIELQRLNPRTFQPVGNALPFDAHIRAGELRGLLTMRDADLGNMTAQIGTLAGALADTLNAAHNDAAAVPPPASLTGRATGLLASDAINFTGRTSLVVAGPDGALVRRLDIDFDAGTIAVDGGAPGAIGGATIGDLAGAINTALAPAGSAAFANGQLTVSASGAGNGVAFVQDAAAPSSRGGRGFAHFFGMNDLIAAGANSVRETGLAAADAHGFTLGGTFDIVLRAPSGEIIRDASVSVGGTSVADLIASMNGQVTGFGTFALDANGAIGFTPAAAYRGAQFEIAADATARGPGGPSVSSFFALGRTEASARAVGLSVAPDIANDPGRLALARVTLDPASAPGDFVLFAGDNSGALALLARREAEIAFPGAGFLNGRATTLGDYAASILSDAGLRAARAGDARDAASALRGEIDARKAGVEGVNLDEELANMMAYQRAYQAGARILSTAGELFDALLATLR